MTKALTYKELIALAKKYYNRGGDGVVECWDEAMFKIYTDMFGPITKEDALRMFETNVETSYDIEYAY
jgi:hypothetical protein